MLKTPYLLFLGDAPDQLAAKVAQGIRDWRPEFAVGQLRLEGCRADVKLPDMTIADARGAGAQTLVVGAANRGGVISKAWVRTLVEAAEAGMDIASGLHNRLSDIPELELFDTDWSDVAPYIYVIRTGGRSERARLVEHLKSAGVATGIHFQGAHEFSYYRNSRRGDLSVTHAAADRVLTLPLHSYMSEADLDRVVSAVTSFYRPAIGSGRATEG